MKRIFVTGNVGSGKTTFCERLSQLLNIPVYHFDQIVWLPGWKRRPPEEREMMIQQLINKTEWIIEGVSASERLMEPADTIIFLDIPRLVCAWRTLKRIIRYRSKTRPDMAADSPDYRNIILLLHTIWDFPRKHNPWVLAALEKMNHDKHIVHIRSSEEMKAFLGTLN